MENRLLAGAWAMTLLAAACAPSRPAVPPADPAHLQDVEEWRQARLASLQSDTGWLTLVGLYWLEPGANRFGTAEDAPVRLPEGTAPAVVGTFFLEDGHVRVRAEPGAGLKLNGEPVTERLLAPDVTGAPDILRVEDLYVYVIQRGERIGIRIKDPHSAARRDFHGLDYFPVDTSYRMQLPLRRYDAPRYVQVPSVLGKTDSYIALGYVEFERGGKHWKLMPVVENAEEKELFFIFGDLTNGEETYGAGRFVYGQLADDDTVTLDFNRSYNPPCVFTPFATCPLPPPENRLALRIEAGEKIYAEH